MEPLRLFQESNEFKMVFPVGVTRRGAAGLARQTHETVPTVRIIAVIYQPRRLEILDLLSTAFVARFRTMSVHCTRNGLWMTDGS